MKSMEMCKLGAILNMDPKLISCPEETFVISKCVPETWINENKS